MNIRIAAIGVGHWHSLYDAAYLKTLAGMPDVELVGLQDRDATLAAERAGQLGHPPVFVSYHDMLDRLRPDFVIVLGRHDEMARTALDVMDAGYPLLIEKPAGIDAGEVEAVAARAREKQAFAAVPLFQRYHPFVACARGMIASGEFGALSHFYFRSLRPTSARYVAWGAPWMLDPDSAGGGTLRNVGLHGIDLFLCVTGEDAAVAGAQTSARALGGRVEDYAAVLLATTSGIAGTIEVGNTFPGKGADGLWQLAGRDALLTMRAGRVHCITAAGERILAEPPAEPLPALALRDTLARWRRGQPPLTGLDACWRAMRIVDRAYAAAQRRPV